MIEPNSRRPFRPFQWVRNILGLIALAVVLSLGVGTAWANFTAVLAWNPLNIPGVAGYAVHYGTDGLKFTNSLVVGTNTTATVPGLIAGTPYFFEAMSRDIRGDESTFSNRAVFLGITSATGGVVTLPLLPSGYTHDILAYSLNTNAPAGISVNPTNSYFNWKPGAAYAYSTNFISIGVSDPVNAAIRFTETVEVIVGGTNGVKAGLVVEEPGQTSTPSPTGVQSLVSTSVSASLADHLISGKDPSVSGDLVTDGSLPLLSLRSVGNKRVLSVYARPGSYALLYTTSMAAPVNWQTLLTFSQTNSVQTLTLTSLLPEGYYRLEQDW